MYSLPWLLVKSLLNASVHCVISVQTIICISIFCKLYQQKLTQHFLQLTRFSMLLQRMCVYLQLLDSCTFCALVADNLALATVSQESAICFTVWWNNILKVWWTDNSVTNLLLCIRWKNLEDVFVFGKIAGKVILVTVSIGPGFTFSCTGLPRLSWKRIC